MMKNVKYKADEVLISFEDGTKIHVNKTDAGEWFACIMKNEKIVWSDDISGYSESFEIQAIIEEDE